MTVRVVSREMEKDLGVGGQSLVFIGQSHEFYGIDSYFSLQTRLEEAMA